MCQYIQFEIDSSLTENRLRMSLTVIIFDEKKTKQDWLDLLFENSAPKTDAFHKAPNCIKNCNKNDAKTMMRFVLQWTNRREKTS